MSKYPYKESIFCDPKKQILKAISITNTKSFSKKSTIKNFQQKLIGENFQKISVIVNFLNQNCKPKGTLLKELDIFNLKYREYLINKDNIQVTTIKFNENKSSKKDNLNANNSQDFIDSNNIKLDVISTKNKIDLDCYDA